MEKMNDLRDLLRMELQDLYSVEEQIIAALPKMIEKAGNRELKNALKEHLRVTEQQKARLDGLQQQMGESGQQESSGLLGRLFKSRIVCEGMQGIIKESNKVLGENMNPDVMDAAIIACAQKIEHYEICGYGTARSYAEELGLHDVARILQQTLDEEKEADRLLTGLAEGRLNRQAEQAGASRGRSGSSAAGGRSGSGNRVTAKEAELEMASAGRGRTVPGNSTRSMTGTGSSRSSKAGGTASPSSTPVTKGSASRNTASSGSTGRSAGSTGRSISGGSTRSGSGSIGSARSTASSAGSSTRGNGNTRSASGGTTRSAGTGTTGTTRSSATRGSGGASGAGNSGRSSSGSSRGSGNSSRTR